MILRDSDDDWFYVYLAADDMIEISLDYFANSYKIGQFEYLNDIDLDLFYDDQSIANNSRTFFNESLTFSAPTSGRYYIVCVIDGTANEYNLTIDITETDDSYEDNDDLAHATRVDVVDIIPEDPVSEVITGLQMRVKDDDYYVTSVEVGLAIIVEIEFSSSYNLDLELLYPNGTVIISSTASTGNSEVAGPFPMNQTFTNAFDNTTDVYFRVYMDNGLTTSYTLNVTVGKQEVLITRQTTADFTPFTFTPYKPGLFEVLVPLAAGGALLGGGTAGGLYAAKKTGALDKGMGWVKGKLQRGDTGGTGGTKKKEIKRSRRKPPS
jgi:hypothetical protein